MKSSIIFGTQFGVSACPAARGEYTSYVPTILKLLEQNDGTKEISEQLEYFRTETMGLPGNKEKNDFTAQILQDYKKAVQRGLA